MLKYPLDTNIVVDVIKRRPIEVMNIFNQHPGRMAISAITLSELLHGAEKSQRVSKNLKAVDDFCCRLSVLPYGEKASQHYGVIRSVLEKAGSPIGVNDLRIAGHARSDGLILVTNNTNEFVRVSALQVENWVA